jgi:hypothetical protein
LKALLGQAEVGFGLCLKQETPVLINCIAATLKHGLMGPGQNRIQLVERSNSVLVQIVG